MQPLSGVKGLGSHTDSLQGHFQFEIPQFNTLFYQWNFHSQGLENFVFPEIAFKNTIVKKGCQPLRLICLNALSGMADKEQVTKTDRIAQGPGGRGRGPIPEVEESQTVRKASLLSEVRTHRAMPATTPGEVGEGNLPCGESSPLQLFLSLF